MYNQDISNYITCAPYFYGYNRNLNNRFLTFQVLKIMSTLINVV